MNDELLKYVTTSGEYYAIDIDRTVNTNEDLRQFLDIHGISLSPMKLTKYLNQADIVVDYKTKSVWIREFMNFTY